MPSVVHYKEFDTTHIQKDENSNMLKPNIYLQGPEMKCSSVFQNDNALWCYLSLEKLNERKALQDFKACLETIQEIFNTVSLIYNDVLCIRILDTTRIEDRETNEDVRADELEGAYVVPVIDLKYIVPFGDKYYVPLTAPILKTRMPKNNDSIQIFVPQDDIEHDDENE